MANNKYNLGTFLRDIFVRLPWRLFRTYFIDPGYRFVSYLGKLLWSPFGKPTTPQPPAASDNKSNTPEIQVQKTSVTAEEASANQSTKPLQAFDKQVEQDETQTNEIEVKETAAEIEAKKTEEEFKVLNKKVELSVKFAKLIKELNQETISPDDAKREVEALIKEGLVLNEKLYFEKKTRATPLECALYLPPKCECADIVELLCKAGTDPSINPFIDINAPIDLKSHRNIYGRTPIEQAVHQNFKDSIESLLKPRFVEDTESLIEPKPKLKRIFKIVTQESLNLAIEKDKKEIIKLLLNHIFNNGNYLTITPQTLLFCAIIRGSLGGVEEAIKQAKEAGQDVFELLNSEFLGFTPLNKSANITNNTAVTQYLIDQGAKLPKGEQVIDFNETDEAESLVENNPSPLKVAIKNDDTEGIEIFLKEIEGKSIDDNKDAQNQTPLFWALQYKPELITSFLEKNADPNHPDINGKTPLTFAIELGRPKDIINLLIENGANPNYTYQDGDKTLSPLSLAMDYENIDAFLAIVDNQKTVNVNVKDKTGKSPLSFALQQLMVPGTTITTDTIKKLLEKGAKVDITIQGEPLLIWLAKQSFEMPHIKEIFSNVLTYAKDIIDFTDKKGYTPLMVLIDRSIRSPKDLDLNLIQSIINAKANINYSEKSGTTPLMVAIDAIRSIDATAGMKETCMHVMELLIKNDNDPEVNRPDNDKKTSLVNQADKEKKTPLMKAVEIGRTEVVKFLLKNKANVDDQDNKGNTPLALAVLKGDLAMATLLIEQQADIIDACDNNGNTPLALAVLNGDFKMAAFLIEQQADINACDNNGNTPLALAVLNRNKDIIELLIKHGAKIDITILDSASKSKKPLSNKPLSDKPLPIFEYIRKEENIWILELFLQNPRIDQNLLVDSKKRTPFQWAIDVGNEGIFGACLRKDPNIVHNYYDEKGETPIMRALRAFHAAANRKDELSLKFLDEIIRLLLLNGDSIDRESKCAPPNTPLTYALKADNPDMLKLLFEKGLEYPDQIDGRTLLKFTIEEGCFNVATFLLSDDKIKEDKLKPEIENLDTFKFILERALEGKKRTEHEKLITSFVRAGGWIHLKNFNFDENNELYVRIQKGYSGVDAPLTKLLRPLKEEFCAANGIKMKIK